MAYLDSKNPDRPLSILLFIKSRMTQVDAVVIVKDHLHVFKYIKVITSSFSIELIVSHQCHQTISKPTPSVIGTAIGYGG